MPLATSAARGGSSKGTATTTRATTTKPPRPQPVSPAQQAAAVPTAKAPAEPSAVEPTTAQPFTAPSSATALVSDEKLSDLPPSIALREPRHHHAAMLESMDRKARELCDDTRRQYELLLARLEAQHERQLQALQHQLKELVATSVPLGEHRQALAELARAHERDTRALVRVHDDEAAALRVRCKQIANEQQLRRSRAFQDEKDQLLEAMAQLEMDRNAALRQWREEELAVLSAHKELQDERHAHETTQLKLQEACQHLVALKAQLPKLDWLAKKVKDERALHAAALAQWTQRQQESNDAAHEVSKRSSVLEAELAHARAAHKTQQDELVRLQGALASREAQVSELQRALAESAAKETLLREFRDSERDAFEQQRSAWRDAQTRLEVQESDARQQLAALQHEKQALAAQCERHAQDATRVAREGEQFVAALREKLRVARAKLTAERQRTAQLEAALAERREEERVDGLLFSSGARR